jgi:hypothetical protein
MPLAREIAIAINDLERQAQPGEVLSPKVFMRLVKPFLSAMRRVDFIAPDVVTFVRDELGLPWPWVAIELCQVLVLEAMGIICGGPWHMTWHVELEDPAAPDLRFTFEVQPGETISTAHRRFIDEANTFSTRLEEAAPAVEVGRVPSDLSHEARDGVGEYARWFYRHRVCGESIRSIAREYHTARSHRRAFDACDCRKAVRYGLGQAERLLSLSQ